jgi:topoisomerase-4 subunit A
LSELKPLMEKNFVEYASYVIIDRAIPDIRDGCKPVQRRILNTLFEMSDGKFHKVANIIGETMKLHPHGDASIGDALVVLANKEYFIEKQGNFGNILTGHDAAAARYIECRLTKLAVENLFNPSLTEYASSYDGRKNEPVAFPVKLPVLLMLGTEGIAVGMSTKILPHNFIELLDAQIKILKKQPYKLYPDFLQGGYIDVSEYDDGKGRVRVRAKIEKTGPKKVVIRELPFSTTTNSIIASVEAAAQKGKVSVGTINDFTTEKVEIELNTSRGVEADTIIPELYAYTDCEVSIQSNIVVIRKDHPVEVTVSEYLEETTVSLRNQIRAELEFELANLIDKQHWLTLEHLFIVNKVYKEIEKAKSEEQIRSEVYKGMAPFARFFIREMADEDVKRLIELRIRRISAYDIKKHKQDVDDIIARIEETKAKLKALTRTTIEYLEGLIETYKADYTRRTEITTFQTVDKKTVAKADIKITYDPETGFFGEAVKGSDYQLTVSEYDRILVVLDDGTYRIVAPPEKMLLDGKVLWCSVFNPTRGIAFAFVYRDDKGVAWGKKVKITKFITDKIYNLFPPSKNRIIYFTNKKPLPKVKLYFEKAKRQKIKEASFELENLKWCTNASRGLKLHEKPVARLDVAKSHRTSTED